jgi:hypothetical protein
MNQVIVGDLVVFGDQAQFTGRVSALHEGELLEVDPITNPDFRAQLKDKFPWLGTQEEAGSGADVIAALSDWYEDLGAPHLAFESPITMYRREVRRVEPAYIHPDEE